MTQRPQHSTLLPPPVASDGAVSHLGWALAELTLAIGFLWLMAGLPGIGSY